MNIGACASGISNRIVLLLALAVFINYVDRGSLATASPLLKDDLDLSNAQMGVLFSAFFWSYAPLQPLAGWIAQRYDARYVLAGGLALWSLATVLTGLATSFAMVLGLRVLLGIGESVTYPCNAKLLAQRAAAHQRGRANGFIAVGQALGPTIGTLVGGVLLAHIGWRATFVAFGLLSLLWLLPWRSATRDGASAAPPGHEQAVSYGQLLREPALWGTGIGHFCGNYAYYFMLTWLPLLLVKSYGFSLTQMAVIGAAVYALHAVTAALAGWYGDRRIEAGIDQHRIWKPMIIIGMVGVAIPMAACAAADATLLVALLLVAGVFFGLQSPSLGSITQTLAGPRAAGRWMGIQNFIANMAGVLAPLITGLVVDKTGEFYWAFAIAAAVTLAGAFAFGLLIRRVAPLPWPTR
jgi:MFS family permease